MGVGMKDIMLKNSCLTEEQLKDYLGDKIGYAWHIEDLHIYDTPKDISEFYSYHPRDLLDCKLCGWKCLCADIDKNEIKLGNCVRNKLKRPPQSWCYLEDLKDE